MMPCARFVIVGSAPGIWSEPHRVDHRRERITQLVRERSEKLVLVLVRDPQRAFGVAALVRFLLERAVRLLERGGALTHLREHGIERVDEHADLVLGRAARAQREVAPLDDLARHLRHRTHRPGHAAREPERDQHRHAAGSPASRRRGSRGSRASGP